MALYNMIVFQLLCFQAVLYLSLIVPLPFQMRKKMLHFIATSPLVAKLVYGLKIMFIFVGVLFLDAVQHMVKVHKEGTNARDGGLRGDLRVETDYRSRKFLSERNMYLTGSTLFLSLILSHTYSIIMDLLAAQEDLATLKKQGGATGRSDAQLEQKLKDLQRDYDQLANKTGQAGAKSAAVKKTE